MKIIDVHTHIFPDKIAEKAVHSISHFYGDTPMPHDGYANELISSGNEIGVNNYLVFSTATKQEQVESINSFIIGELSKYPQFIGLGTMFLGYTDYEKELIRLKENDINGIKLHPDFQKFRFDDPGLYPIFDMLSELNMFVLTHAGDNRYNFSNPEKIAKIAKEFPKLNIIGAHFGGWSEWDKAIEELVLPNVYYDTSSTMGFVGLDTAKKAFSKYDNSHIFFGSDFPMWDHKKEFENIQKLGLSSENLENVMGKNFLEFYKKYSKREL